jgi:hypothetical protein
MLKSIPFIGNDLYLAFHILELLLCTIYTNFNIDNNHLQRDCSTLSLLSAPFIVAGAFEFASPHLKIATFSNLSAYSIEIVFGST